MFISDFSIKRSVTTTMLIMVLVVLGAISIKNLSIEMMPEIEFPMATIMTDYKNVGPEEIEGSVTRLIEASVNRVSGVENIYSTSSRGLSVVSIDFKWGTNMDAAMQDLREKMDEMGGMGYGLPEEAGKPIIMKMNLADIPLAYFAISWKGKNIHDMKELVEQYFQSQLESVDGVAQVVAMTGPPRQVIITLNRRKLNAYGISFSEVMQKLRMENMDASAGRIKEGYKDYLVRIVGKYKEVEEIKNTLISVRKGVPVYLKDLAQITDAFAEEEMYTRHNLDVGAGLMLSKQSGKNTVDVSRAVWKKIDEIKKLLPEGVEIKAVFDQAEYVEKSIGNVASSAWQGGILVVLILFLFLRYLRPVMIIAVAIPVSLLASFIPMYFAKMNLNMMSLGGLALAIGMLVDNSIVVLENIFRRIQENKEDPVTAASLGSREVGTAIVASTLTTVAVFVPIAFTPGIAARIFREFSLTVTFSLFASLFIALTLVPMAASKILDRKISIVTEGGILRRYRNWYENFLPRILKRKKTVFAGVMIFFIATLLLLIPMGKEFMSQGGSRQFFMTTYLPYGTNVDETNRISDNIERYLMSFKEVEFVDAMVGIATSGSMESTNSEQATIILNFKKGLKKAKIDEIAEKLRNYVNSIPEVSRVDLMNMSGMGGMGSGKPVEIKLFGKDLATLNEIADRVQGDIKQIKGIKDTEKTFTFGSPEVQIKFDREKCARLGLSAAQAAAEASAAIGGSVATRIERKGDELDVTVRLIKEERANISDVEKIVLVSPMGRTVQLKDVAKIEKNSGPTDISRENQKRKIAVKANIAGRDLGHIMQDVQAKVSKIAMPTGYFVEYGGTFKNMSESFRDLGLAFLLALVLVYMVMASLYESYVHPFAIAFTIPFSLIGVIWFMLFFGEPLSINAMIGVIVLAGIIVNNGIVFIDYTNQLRQQGMDRVKALSVAGSTRLRPILMTTLTTILGLVPMLLGGGEGAEMRRPLAITLIGGLSVGTLLTLFVLPTIYSILEDIRDKILKKKPDLQKTV